MAGTISFSGLSSGVDTSGWVDALVSVKQETVTSLQTKQAEQEKLLSIVNEIKSYFTSFQSCLQKITDAQFGVTSMDLFAQNLAISSNSNVVTATATTEAARQSYDVVVDKLATATKATSGYSQYEVKTATLDTTFGTLGGTNGTVTVNQQSFVVTTDDTLRTIIEKFKNVGVDAEFDENTGKFSLGVSVGEIDEGATNLKGALRLKDNNVDGATSGSLMYATRETEFSKLGLTAGKVNIEGESHTITKNGDNYTIAKTGGASHSLNTIGDFLDYLLTDAVKAESANIDDKGNISIMGATMDPVGGGSNILDVLNLTESDDRIVVESDKLSYIEVRAADLNTQLSQLGINADTTLTVGGTTHTITNDKTLGDVKALLNAGGVDLSIDSEGLLTIDTNGNEISGTLLDVLGLDPTKNGTTITSSVHNSAFDATKNTVLSDLGVNNSHNYTAYKSDGTALNTPTSNLMNKTIEELIADLRALGLDASFDEDTKKITIKDGYIEGTLADQLGMTEEETSYTENATGETTLEKLGATGNQTLTIDGGAAVTYNKDTTLETIINDLEAAGADVTFKNGNLTVQGVTLGGTLPTLLGLDATTQGTTVTSGDLSVVTNNTSTGTEQTETVQQDLSLTSKIGDITGTTANYTMGVDGGTVQTFTKDSTLGDVKALIEGAGGTFIINDDNTITVADVTMTGTLVGALGFDAVDEGTKFTTVDPVYVTGTSNVAQGNTTLGELGVVVQTFALTPVAGATLSIDGGAEKTYDATTTLDDIFDDIRAAGGTASVDSDGYIVIEGVNLSGTVVDALGLEATANRTTITSGDLKVTTSTKATSSSALQGVSAGNITGDSTIGSITGDTNSYNLSINGAAATTYTTGTKLSAIQTAIANAGGTMTINADNTITVSGVELNGTLLDALGFDVTDYKTTITSNTPIYTPGDEVDATASTTFNQLGIAADKRDYAIYANDGTIIQASSTSGTASTKTIGDWLSILNSKLNTANGTSGQTYAKIENGIISITGGYVTGSLPTALGIGIESETIGVTMSGSSITYIESDPLKFIGGVTTGAGQAGSNVDYTGNVTDTTEQEGESAGIANNDSNLVGSATQEGNAEGNITDNGYVTGTTTQGGTATGDVTVSGDVGTSGTQEGNAEGDMSSTGSIGTDVNATGSATGNTTSSGTIADETNYVDLIGNITNATLSATLTELLSPTATNPTEEDGTLAAATYTLKIGSYDTKTFNANTTTLQDVIDYVDSLKVYDSTYNIAFDAYIDTSTNKLVIKADTTITGTLADAIGLTKNDALTTDEYYTYTAANVTYTDLVEGGTDDGYNFQITGTGKVEYDKEETEGTTSYEYTGEKITYTVTTSGTIHAETHATPETRLVTLNSAYEGMEFGCTKYDSASGTTNMQSIIVTTAMSIQDIVDFFGGTSYYDNETGELILFNTYGDIYAKLSDGTTLEFGTGPISSTSKIKLEDNPAADLLCSSIQTKSTSGLTSVSGVSSFSTSTTYLISTKADLLKLEELVNAGKSTAGVTFVLGADIRLDTGVSIGNSEANAFKGIIYGNGYTISNNTMSGTDSGLFGYFKGMAYDIIFEKCGNWGNSLSSDNVGVFAGVVLDEAIISNMKFNCCNLNNLEVDAAGFVAGLINGSGVTIEYCGSDKTSSINGSVLTLGGIVGEINDESTWIKKCYNEGSLSTTSSNAAAGGIVGYLSTSASAQIYNIYNRGSLYASSSGYVGGIVGQSDVQSGLSCDISTGYNTGSITAANANAIGGLVGCASGPELILENLIWLKNSTVTSELGKNTSGASGYMGNEIVSVTSSSEVVTKAQQYGMLEENGWYFDYSMPTIKTGGGSTSTSTSTATTSTTIGELFGDTSSHKLTIQKTGGTAEDLTFATTDTLQTVIDKLGEKGITATFDTTTGKLTVEDDEQWTFSGEVAPKIFGGTGNVETGGGDAGGSSGAKVYLSDLSGDYSNVTSGDTYYIKTKDDMLALASLTDAGKSSGVNFVLENDINLGSNWNPIGTSSSSAFKGNFYGDGHQISFSDVSQDAVNSGIAGLFGYVNNATIKGLKLNATINNARRGKIGLLAAVISGSTLVQGVITYGTMNGLDDGVSAVGGIVGQADSGTKIKNVWNQAGINVGITSGGGIGGIVGTSEATIEVAHNSGSIHVDDNSNAYVGGIAGIITEMTNHVKHISNNAQVRGVGSVVGGLIGHNEANVSYGICTGTVSGGKADSNAAVADRLNGTLSEIYYYNSNTPLMSGSSTVGGMIRVGSEQELVNKYNTGQFTQANGWYTAGGVPFAYVDSDINSMQSKFGYTGSDSSSNTTNNGGGAAGGSGDAAYIMEQVSTQITVTNTYTMDENTTIGDLFGDTADHTFTINGEDITLGSTDTVQDLIDQLQDKGYEVLISDGKMTIGYDGTFGSGNSFTVSGDLAEKLLKTTGTVTADYETTDVKLSTSSKMSDIFWDENNHTFKIDKVSGTDVTITLGKNDTIQTLINKLKENGIVATIDANGKMTFKSNYQWSAAGDLGTLITGGSAMSKTTTYLYTYGSEKLEMYTGPQRVKDMTALVAGNKYHIQSYEDLVKLAEFVNGGTDVTGCRFYLDNDVDMSSVADFAGIGNSTYAFDAKFYGNGHVIKNLKMTSTDENTGLFNVTNGAIIQDVGLEGVTISGAADVGALIGEATNTTVNNCYSKGTVTGSGKRVGGLIGIAGTSTLTNLYSNATVTGSDVEVGGLIGTLDTGSSLTKSYATGHVTSSKTAVGGLVGRIINATIDKTYATGDVKGSSIVGGLLGVMNGGTIKTSYATGMVYGTVKGGFIGKIVDSTTISGNVYNSSTEIGKAVGDGAETGISGKALVDIATKSVMVAAGFKEADGWVYTTGTTPTFGNVTVGTHGTVYVKDVTQFDAGNTYFIKDADDLVALADLVNTQGLDTTGVAFVLEGNINMDGIDFIPIGTSTNSFKGDFYGNGYEIQKLSIDLDGATDGQNYVGLFGKISSSIIRDVNLTDAYVTGKGHVGGLVGYVDSTSSVTNCSVKGTVTGTGDIVGGLVGYNAGTITQSYSNATVSGASTVGGLVGSNSGGNISKSYATGNVSGTSIVGGFAGVNNSSGTITMAYAKGNVSGTSSVGGFVGGLAAASTTTKSYATGKVTGTTAVGAFAGKIIAGATVSGNVANKGSGDAVVNAQSVGDGATTGITFAVIEDMRSKTYMENLGFKADEGWVYFNDASYDGHATVTPTLGGVTVSGGGQVYVSSLSDFRIGDTYFLKDASDLEKLAELVNAGKNAKGVVFIMEDDIDMSTVADFAGIGKYVADEDGDALSAYVFQGDFYGNGYVIKNLTSSTGLFVTAGHALIKDVGMENVTITSSIQRVGSLLGVGWNTVVENCYVNGGSITSNYNDTTDSGYVGGLIGTLMGGTVSNSYSTVDVISNAGAGVISFVGGLIGATTPGDQGATIFSNVSITKCFATGDVKGKSEAKSYVGGLLGVSWANLTISSSYSTGHIVDGYVLGGFVGSLNKAIDGTSDVNISNSYSSSSVLKTGTAGGFIGKVFATVTNITSTGNVYNSSTELNAVGNGTMSGITGKTLTDMATQSVMTDLGFTTDKGWAYVDGTTPTLGNATVANAGHVYVKDITEFESGDTYYLKTADDLKQLKKLVNDDGLDTTGVFFVLEDNIDMGEAEGFAPIGTSTNAFKGDFYGNGHEIQNLTIDLDDATTGISYVGLFGKVQSSQIRDVGLTNVSIAGKGYVGGLAGSVDANSSVTNCYVTGSVTGTDNIVGGLIGSNTGTITQSYSNATVSGKMHVGGLAGANGGTITKSFALGNVSGTSNVGGFVGSTTGTISVSFAKGNVTGTSSGGFAGSITAGSVTKSYATGDAVNAFAGSIADTGVTISGNVANKGSGDAVVNASAVGTGSSTGITLTVIENMRDKSLMESYGIKATDGWAFTDDGRDYVDDDLDDLGTVTPTLGGVSISGGGHVYVSELTDFRIGDTYYLQSVDDLKKLSELVKAGKDTTGVVFVMEADIDLNSEEFTPIGTLDNKFKGDFYGNGFTISNLKVTATGNGAGLFGYATNAKIQDLGLENVDVSGTGMVGALVGSIGDGSEIYNVYATGKVQGSGENIGGLIGVSGSTTIRDSYAEVIVTGNKNVGGFIGSAASGASIDRAYATGRVYVSDSVGGGFAGTVNQAAIENVFATGNVNATVNTVKHLGGLVGNAGQCVINTAYSTGRVLGTTTESGGAIGNCAADAALTYVVFNSNTELDGIGKNAGTQSVTGKTIIEMTDETTMTNLGFTTAKGWKYLDDTTPTFGVGTTVVENGGKVYVSAVSEFRAGNTYYIKEAADLERLSELVNLGEETNASVFILDNDIDMSGVADFVSIGSATGTAFRGDFYGNGHTISGFKQTGDDAKGLFGNVEKAIIQDVGIVDANITGTGGGGILANRVSADSVVKNVYTTGSIEGNNIAGLVNDNYGQISESYSTANVFGVVEAGGLVNGNYGTIKKSFATGRVYTTDEEANAGGFVAVNSATGVIESCYALGNVVADGDSVYAGGFAGTTSGTITNSYSTGIVQGTSTETGGFIGNYNSGTLTGNVYNSNNEIGAVGSGSDTGITGLELRFMEDADRMKALGFTEDKGWKFVDGFTPLLTENATATENGKVYVSTIDRFDAGNVYYLSTAADVQKLAELVNNGELTKGVTFVLDANIDMASVANFAGIGTETTAFKGDFYGGGYTISNLKGNSLFTVIEEAIIRDVGLDNVTISSTGDNVGALVGKDKGNSSIINSYVSSGTISGANNTGGLVGTLGVNSLIEDSYVEATINGKASTGGLVGNSSGTVINSYTSGTVKGTGAATGGLIGTMNENAIVQSSYSSANVQGTTNVGGLVGSVTKATITNSYSTGTVTGSTKGAFIGSKSGTCTLTGNYYNSAVGANSAGGATGISLDNMKDQSIMESYGFTADKGWVYYEDKTPQLRAESGENAIDKKVSLDTALGKLADATVSKDLQVVVNGNTYSKTFNDNDTVEDVMTWLNTISDIDATYDETNCKFEVSADYADLSVTGGIANMLFGGNATTTLDQITVNTNSSYLIEPGAEEKITKDTVLKDLLPINTSATIGYLDETGKVVMQTFDNTKTIEDVMNYLNSKGFTTSIVDGVFTATKANGAKTDLYGTIGLALKGADGTTDSVGSGYVSEVLSSETSGTATGTTTLEELGVNSGDIHIKDAKGNILQTLIIDNQMTVNDVADLLSNYGLTMTIDAGKITVEGENTKRIVDGSSNMVSQMKLNNWTGTEEKLTNTSTIAEMGFSNGAHLGIIMNGQVQAGYNFDADDTLADVIAKLESSGITASVDADGKFTATANGTFVLTDELGNYLTQDSANGYEKEANGYISSDPLEFFDPAELLTEDTLIGELLGTGQGGTLRLSLDSHQVVDLDYAATDTVRDIMTDLAGFGISTNITDGVLTAVSTDRTFKFDGDIGEAISGYNPRYEDLSTGYISKDLSYETKGVANYDSTLKELGISSGEIHLLSSDGKRISSLAIDESFTVAQVKSMLQPYNMELTMDANGKVTVSSPEGYKLTDGTSNMVSKMGLNNWTTTEEKLTLDTTVGQMGFKDGADLNLLLDGSIRNTLSFSADQTLQDIIFTLSAYGIDASVDADGKFTAVSKEHTFVMSSSLGSFLTKGTTGYVNDDTGYETYKPLEEEFPLITQTTEQLGYEKPMTLDSTLSSLGYENGGNVRLLLDNGTVHNLSFLGTDTVDEIVYALSAYGINADVVDGKFVAESVDNSFTISGNLGSYLVSGGTYQNEVTQYQNTLTYEEEVNVTNDTKLSDLGVTKGDLHVIKDGELQSSVIKITEDTTVGQFFNALKPYGLTGSILTDATTGETKIEIAGINTQLADGTSNVVSGLNLMQVRQGDFDGNVIYWEEDATSGLITEDMLISDFDKDGYIGQGSLIFETGTGDDAVQHIVNVTANETVGSLLKKFNDQGIKATLDNGIIKISAGLDGITFTGGTSGLINTLGLDIQNIDTYCESEVALTYTGDVEYSASNFADANTKLEIVNATNGVMSIFVDGVKCSIQVNTTDTFSDLFQRISSTVAARTGQTIKVGFLDKSGNIVTNPTAANNTGIVAMEIAEGHELVIGASNDTTNFATIANLNKTDYHRVEGSRALYKVNINSKITESGLFRDGNITMGTFTIGDAEFTIDENTTLKSLTEAISKSENSYATAYWDTLSGTLVIQSTLTGASLINIEAGTSNFTDILGFTKVNADGTKALVTENQKLGNNAVIRINGTTVTSSSNVITSDVSKIKGLTLNLKGVSEGETVTISVEQDREGIFNAVSDTIDSYNAMMDALGKELEKDDSLGSEIILKLMRNNLKRLMTSSLSGSYMYKNLSAIGISTGEAKDSTTLDVTSLMIDKDKFIDALTIDSDAVKDLLVGTTASPGIFLQANNIVESTIKADGYFSNMANSLSKNISKIEQKIQKANNSIETYKLKLERQFHNMELTITNMQSSYSNFLN